MKTMLVVLALTLTACGGSSGSKTQPDAKPGGFYTGSFVSDATGEAVRVDGIVLETGEAVFLSKYGTFTTVMNPDGDDLDAGFEALALWGTTWDGINTYLHGNIEGTVSERAGINGTYTLGSDSGTFALTYDAEGYEVPSSLAKLTGNWGYSIPSINYAVSLSIDSRGVMYGQDTNGCTYQATISVVDPAFNAYRMENASIHCADGALTNGEGVATTVIDPELGLMFTFGAQYAEKSSLIDFYFKQ